MQNNGKKLMNVSWIKRQFVDNTCTKVRSIVSFVPDDKT